MQVLRFSFWGGGATNHGNELLELACNYYYEYPANLQTAILINYLVNPSGLSNHWHKLDLLQERFNLWIKRVFNKKNSDFDSKFMKKSVPVNVTGFGRLRNTFMSMLRLSKIPSGRSVPDYEHDINVLATRHRPSSLLTFEAGRSQSFTAVDMFSAGYEKLEAGSLSKFLEQKMLDPELIYEETVDDSDMVEPDIPPEPLVSENGVLRQGEGPDLSVLM